MGQTLGFSWWDIWLHTAPVKKKKKVLGVPKAGELKM